MEGRISLIVLKINWRCVGDDAEKMRGNRNVPADRENCLGFDEDWE
jgi:hypothetical protein